MTTTATTSPAPWHCEYSPYRLQAAGAGGKELPAFEVFDAEGNKLFDTNEDMPSEIQEANACLATAAPELLAALKECAILLADYDEHAGPEGEAYRHAVAAIAEATAASTPLVSVEADIHAMLARRRQIAIIWSVEDVQEIRPDLTEEQAWEVLQQADRRQDAEIGIDWGVIESHAELLFGDARETDDAEEA